MMAATMCSPCLRGRHGNCVTQACTCDECHPPVVTWETPPPSRGRRPECPATDIQIKELQANLGRWAIIKTYNKHSSASTAAGRVNRGAYPQLPEGEWKATSRQTANGSSLYLRYTGPAGDKPVAP